MIPLISAKSCKTCKFVLKLPQGLECRHSPPTANALFTPDGRGGVQVQAVVSIWPIVQADSYCHQHMRGINTDLEQVPA